MIIINLTIKQKILGGFSIVLILMIIMGGISFYLIDQITNLNSEAQKLNDQYVGVLQREIDHLEWVNNLADVILRQDDFSGEVYPTKCAFGNDYYKLLNSI